MLRSGLFLFFGLLAGRALGLVREIYLAGTLGAGPTADVIIALITLPDIVIGLLLGNALAVAFLTRIASLPMQDRFGLFLKLSAIVFGFFCALSLLLTWNISHVATWLLPSQSTSTIFHMELLWVTWAIPILSLSAVSRLFLQSQNRFGLFGLENVIFNICIIAGVILFSTSNHLRIISIAVSIGAILRWGFQAGQLLSILPRQFSGWSQRLHPADFRKYSLAFTTGLALQILPLFARSMTSFFEQDGALSIFNYAYKLAEFPIALGTSVLSAVIFPRLAELAAKSDEQQHTDLFAKGHEGMMALTIPISIMAPLFLWLLSDRQLSFHSLSATEVSMILSCIAISLLTFFFRGLNDLYATALNSLGEVTRPMMATLLGSAVALCSAYFLIQAWGIRGAFWSLNTGYVVMFLANLVSLQTLAKPKGTSPLRQLARQSWTFAPIVLVASILFAGSTWLSTPMLFITWGGVAILIGLRITLPRLKNMR